LQQAMVVTVREESQTNNATRDYLTDLTYQCPKGTYKLGCSYDENDPEYETTELLHHENIKYPQQVVCMMTISEDEEQVEFTSLTVDRGFPMINCQSKNHIFCCGLKWHYEQNMTADEHSSRLINWHESVEKWCKIEDLGVQSYKVKMELPSLYHTTGCDKFPLWGIIAGFFLMFAASILFFYYDRIHILHLCPKWLKKSTHYVHGNAAQSLVNNERNSTEIKPPASHEIKLAHPKLTSDIQYCYKNKKPMVLGEGRYGFVYKANYEEQCIAVKCINREEKAEHEKIMFDLIGSRSDNLLRLTAYVSKHCDPHDRPTSVLLLPAYLQGDIGSFLKRKYDTEGGISEELAIQLMRTLACGLYELHRASEGIDNPMPRIAHRDLKPANVLISDRFEAVICDFNSSIPLIRELPHQCDCFSKPDDRNGPCRPFEPLSLLKLESHDRPGCPNRKILQKLDDVRERVFYQKCPDGTWLYMAPEVLSLSMFDTGDMVPTNSDMVNRYCSVDIYSFGLICWIILSQCDGFLVPGHKLESNVDDFLFHEFSSQSKIDLTKINMRSLAEKEKLMDKIVNEENLRPRCGSSQLFDVIRDCWASDGAYRPDARQIYRKIKDLSTHYSTRM